MPPARPLKLINAQLQVVRAKLRADDWDTLSESLQAIRGMGYDGQPVVFDLAGLTTEEVDAAPWDEIVAEFRSVGLRPIALTGLEDSVYEGQLAATLGMAKVGAADLGVRLNGAASGYGPLGDDPSDEASGEHDTPDLFQATSSPASGSGAARAAAHADPAAAGGDDLANAQMPWHPPMLVKRQVRSGQQIYARNRDLIVLASVSPGAEVIADGNIACYGSLHGRAIAGASGKADACIHALDFRPELVAVAGLYMTFESGPPTLPSGRMVQVRLDPDGDRLITESI